MHYVFEACASDISEAYPNFQSGIKKCLMQNLHKKSSEKEVQLLREKLSQFPVALWLLSSI